MTSRTITTMGHTMAVSILLITSALALSVHVTQHTDAAENTDENFSPELEQRLIRNSRQLTFEGRRAGEGYFSQDGKQLVFQSEREPGNPFFQIYLMDLENGDVLRVSPGIGKTTCAWIHSDGHRVLFASTHEDEHL